MVKKTSENKVYIALKKAISENKLGNFYILYGKEDYLREYYLGEMKKSILGDGPSDFNLRKLDGRTLGINELIEAVESFPSFSDRTFVEVRDFDIFKASEDVSSRLISIFKDIPDYCCLVFVYDSIEYKADKRKKLNSIIEDKASVVEITVQEHSDLINWIRRRFAHNGKRISKEDAEYLIYYSGDLMTGLISEIEKISAYCKSDYISREDIDTVAVPVLDAVAFNLTNAISKNDYNLASEIMAELFQMRENPIMLLSIIGGQLRKLYAARLLYENGKNAKHLKSMLDIRSDYQANILMESAPLFSLKWCAYAVNLCAETDLLMKSSSFDENELLTTFLVRLAGERAA